MENEANTDKKAIKEAKDLDGNNKQRVKRPRRSTCCADPTSSADNVVKVAAYWPWMQRQFYTTATTKYTNTQFRSTCQCKEHILLLRRINRQH